MSDPRASGRDSHRQGGQEGPMPRKACPNCGEEFGQLAHHLANCDGEGSA